MSKKFKLFVSCDKANHTCNKTQYNEATFLEKIKLSFHLLFCKACRKFSKNNGKLTKLVKDPKVDCLKKCEKEQLQNDFKKELENH